MRSCTFIGCDRPHYGRDLCNAHWQQQYRLKIALKPLRGWGPGHPMGRPVQIVHRPIRVPRVCAVVACDRSHRRNGLCDTHSGIAKKYALSAKDLADLLASSDRCQSCGQEWNGRWGAPNIDHDHETGVVRGLLCLACNLTLGHSLEDPSRLRALADYIERAPQGATA